MPTITLRPTNAQPIVFEGKRIGDCTTPIKDNKECPIEGGRAWRIYACEAPRGWYGERVFWELRPEIPDKREAAFFSDPRDLVTWILRGKGARRWCLGMLEWCGMGHLVPEAKRLVQLELNPVDETRLRDLAKERGDKSVGDTVVYLLDVVEAPAGVGARGKTMEYAERTVADLTERERVEMLKDRFRFELGMVEWHRAMVEHWSARSRDTRGLLGESEGE